MRELEGRRAVVSGGNSGIGQAIATKQADSGVATTIADINTTDSLPENCFSFKCDVSSGQDVDALFTQVHEKIGVHIQLSCSWNLPAGQEAIISATFYDTNGGVVLININGSFYDFVAERYYGTKAEKLSSPPDEWSGRAGVVWVERLAKGEGFDEAAEEFVKVAEVLDKIYGR